jgi:hypothetical protein
MTAAAEIRQAALRSAIRRLIVEAADLITASDDPEQLRQFASSLLDSEVRRVHALATIWVTDWSLGHVNGKPS